MGQAGLLRLVTAVQRLREASVRAAGGEAACGTAASTTAKSPRMEALRESLPPARREVAVYWLAVMFRHTQELTAEGVQDQPLADTGGEPWPR
ncbi:hypothetical protein ABZ499_32120 [Streptomyces sp. NPDC019990]|uniref:hypothetical protein n=1 Tax=Streptomyces sp. NPDC019990 TaxID=3154693 RepID=UPI0033C0C5BA